MKTIRLMADYGWSPLWEPGADAYSAAPESLPLSADLQEKLWAWAAIYDATLDRADPASSDFSLEVERQEFILQGSILRDQLQEQHRCTVHGHLY